MMDRKNAGIEYDREAFIPAADRLSDSNPSLRGVLVLVASIAAIIALAFLGYKIVAQSDVGGGSPSDSRVLGQLDQRLSGIEQRLEQLEQENHRRTYAFPALSPKADAPAAASAPPVASPPRYQVIPTQKARAAAVDAATQNKIAGLQQGLGAVQSDTAANRDALQATSNRLADVAG
ncbi:MAG: hypothetical protein WCC03_05845, partial [Candidatus Acidiferrales bacterium]